MKWLILNVDYAEFLLWFYAQHSGLEHQSYAEQMQARNASLFGVADFFSSNLRRLGHEARDIHANNLFMQRAWAQEYSASVVTPALSRRQSLLSAVRWLGTQTLLRVLKPLTRPVWHSLTHQPHWFYDILAAQIEYYDPDVLLIFDMGNIGTRFLKEMKAGRRLLVGQIASPVPQGEDWSCYDLVTSSLPNIAEYFHNAGVPAVLHRLGFEPWVLDRLGKTPEKNIAASFVGSLSPQHHSRVRLLEYLCEHPAIHIWGQIAGDLPSMSPIHRRYRGKAWGIEMYEILRRSKITLNHHIGAAESYANNMRLYEATGVGTLLITDWKQNLTEMFEPGKEVVTYHSPKECAELIEYYLAHDAERETIARAGRQRTLREHTYYQRVQELVEIVRKYL